MFYTPTKFDSPPVGRLLIVNDHPLNRSKVYMVRVSSMSVGVFNFTMFAHGALF